MRRKALISFDQWKSKKDRYPLLVRGARQVGKTWLVREHAKSYKNFVEINLEAQTELIPAFKDLFGKPAQLITAISQLTQNKITLDSKTLLFIDEIQACPEALLSLRYFKEKLPTLPVIAAGSLLEFAFSSLSFPVGRIDFLHLFPMNFEEFMLARGREDMVGAIKKIKNKPLATSVHEMLLKDVGLYTLLGGMPEVVRTHIEGGDLNDCQAVQQRLVVNYREDFHKYAPMVRIDDMRQVFASIPRLLGQKFKYSHVDPHSKSRELAQALNLLVKAGLAYKACHSSANGLPLEAQIKPEKFKVFFVDVGLCLRLLGLSLSQLSQERPDFLSNRGAIAEQLVAQELLSCTQQNESPAIYYWHREQPSAQAEVDLLIEQNGFVVPIEVKSQKGTGMKSLHQFLLEKKQFVKTALRISSHPYGITQNILSLPKYAVCHVKSSWSSY
ncbi:MAG: ATP-binding protein [Deltaproteobacteria bacterium]|nr:ATP-binding protein [Deltaproteobacteria bacterium]